MKSFKSKIKDCAAMTLTVKYDKDTQVLSFYNDDLLMEQFDIKDIIEHYKPKRLVAGQVISFSDAERVYNCIIDFMFDEHKEIYDTIVMNNKFIGFLENIVKEDN